MRCLKILVVAVVVVVGVCVGEISDSFVLPLLLLLLLLSIVNILNDCLNVSLLLIMLTITDEGKTTWNTSTD
jgi:hypothetical protein